MATTPARVIPKPKQPVPPDPMDRKYQGPDGAKKLAADKAKHNTAMIAYRMETKNYETNVRRQKELDAIRARLDAQARMARQKELDAAKRREAAQKPATGEQGATGGGSTIRLPSSPQGFAGFPSQAVALLNGMKQQQARSDTLPPGSLDFLQNNAPVQTIPADRKLSPSSGYQIDPKYLDPNYAGAGYQSLAHGTNESRDADLNIQPVTPLSGLDVTGTTRGDVVHYNDLEPFRQRQARESGASVMYPAYGIRTIVGGGLQDTNYQRFGMPGSVERFNAARKKITDNAARKAERKKYGEEEKKRDASNSAELLAKEAAAAPLIPQLIPFMNPQPDVPARIDKGQVFQDELKRSYEAEWDRQRQIKYQRELKLGQEDEWERQRQLKYRQALAEELSRMGR